MQQAEDPHWDNLSMQFNDTLICLDRLSGHLAVVLLKDDVREYKIDQTREDFLFLQANELINFKGHPKWFCTDYVGKLKVRIRYDANISKEIYFNSICSWREINVNTKAIDLLLKKIIGLKRQSP